MKKKTLKCKCGKPAKYTFSPTVYHVSNIKTGESEGVSTDVDGPEIHFCEKCVPKLD